MNLPENKSQTQVKLCPFEWVVFSLSFGVALAFLFLATKNYLSSPSFVKLEKQRPRSVTVFIDGAVKNRGCYTLPEGSLVSDLLTLGEPLEKSNLSKFSHNPVLFDGQKIRVPRK